MFKNRNTIIFKIFLLAFVVLITRMFYFQICKGKSLTSSAAAQRITSMDIEKPRGDIVDRNGIRFTNRNIKSMVVLKPLVLRHNLDDVEKVCKILGEDFYKVKRLIETEREPILIEANEEKRNKILNDSNTGISIVNLFKRYDDNTLARHILGYLNKVDQIGEAGLEKYYEDALKYDMKSKVGVITDARRNLVEGLGYRMVRQDGNDSKLDIKLTLDYHIQKIAESVMERNHITGAVVIEDVCTGDIVAMASKPDFDQNDVEKFLYSQEKELFNRAVASYNLGSIFKIIDAALIFQSGISVNEEYFCTGSIKVGGKEFKCTSFEKGGHGNVDMVKAFAVSCNPYFISKGMDIGYKNLISMAEKFGLGKVTGINESGVNESPGNLPDINSYYSNGDIANISIGQGDIMATPVQVANMVATIANGGIMNKVNIVDSIIDSSGNRVRSIRKNEGSRIIDKEIADKIKVLMEEVTITGTGTKANLDKYGGAGGKTGSAETGVKDVVHAWFAGYFPKRDPKYSIAVFVENGQYGGKIAAPIFAEIAEEIMRKGY